MTKVKQRVSTESYKGVRDFYPEDRFIQEYMFEIMSRVCESFGYESYSASVLEPAELYRSKTSEEIVTEQTYTFTDRGDREVTLRPEMTPTVARMVAARARELSFPLRWYSIPNVFRYERPQKGRLREHWQLNADIFGVSGIEADVELIALAHSMLLAFGATEDDFEIRINDRQVLNALLAETGVPEKAHAPLMRLLDKKDKLDKKIFQKEVINLVGEAASATLLSSLTGTASSPHLESLIASLGTLGITNVYVDTSIVRGFDYYTGMVFEVYDTSSENSRSMFGGGRYDNLLSLFGVDPIPIAGFAVGDVTLRDFLTTHELLPPYVPATMLFICILSESATQTAVQLAEALRTQDVTVAVNYTYKSAGDQMKVAAKKHIPFALCIGDKEIQSGEFMVKNLTTREEKSMQADAIATYIFESSL